MGNLRAPASGSALFGGLLGVMSIALFALHQGVAAFSILAAYSAIHSIVTWRRTRLAYLTLGSVTVLVFCVVMAGLWPYRPGSHVVLAVVVVAGAMVLLFRSIEKLRSPQAMKEMTDAAHRASLVDILLVREIPWLVRERSENKSLPSANPEQPPSPPSAGRLR